MSHNWGYKEGQKHAKEMGLTNTPSRVTVKPHSRAPRMAKAPPAPVTPALDTPKMNVGMKTGGPVKPKKKGC